MLYYKVNIIKFKANVFLLFYLNFMNKVSISFTLMVENHITSYPNHSWLMVKFERAMGGLMWGTRGMAAGVSLLFKNGCHFVGFFAVTVKRLEWLKQHL